MSDEFEGGCAHDKGKYDSSLVEDPIDIIDKIPVMANTVQPIWLSVEVPTALPAGKYSGTISMSAIKKYDLKITVNVLNHILPPASKWKYDLDLWQYPAPIAQMHNVPLWSKAHFDLIKPYYKALAKAGQKAITANIIEQPWGDGHVYFKDPTLIKWIKKKDSTWFYDFSLFDKYISFVMSCGINKRINCYSMITWDLSFIYFDEATGKNISVKVDPVTAQYSNFWAPMLQQFTKHLKQKGWFNITAIAMDERPIESMNAVIALLKNIDANWKVSLATDNFHPEIQKDIFDLSIASYLKIDDSVLTERKAVNKPTTFYTACKENHPGPYTFSPPAENTWLAWHAAFKGYTGYLFWAYNTWPPNPLQDARYSHYPSGTFFEFYPGPRSSIRFEKLIEGIQDFEKIRLLKEEFIKEGKLDNLNELNKILSGFEIRALDSISAGSLVEKGKEFLNKF